MSVKLKILERQDGKCGLIEVDAELLDHKIHGFACFIHRSINTKDWWTISEFSTGVGIGEGHTIQNAIESADQLASEKGKPAFEKEVIRLREKYGIANTELPQPTL